MWHSRHSTVVRGLPFLFQCEFAQLSYWFWSWTQPTRFTSASMNCLWHAAQYSGFLNERLASFACSAG